MIKIFIEFFISTNVYIKKEKLECGLLNKKSLAGIGIGIAVVVAILVILSSANLATNTGNVTPSNATTGGLPATTTPALSTSPMPAKKNYTLELNESVGIATK